MHTGYLIITFQNICNILKMRPLTLRWMIILVEYSDMPFIGPLHKEFTTIFVIVVSHLLDEIFTFQK